MCISAYEQFNIQQYELFKFKMFFASCIIDQPSFKNSGYINRGGSLGSGQITRIWEGAAENYS